MNKILLLFLLLFAKVVFLPANPDHDGLGQFYTGAFARINLSTPSSLLLPYTSNAPQITSRAAVLIDAETGTVLFAQNPHEEIPPASLTKLMTMHLVKREALAGNLSLDELVPIGIESWAQSQPPRSSLMFLAPGQIVTLRELLLGLAVPSGNDAAVAVALRLAPTVQDFAGMMTLEAQRMGLYRTRFVEPSGISEHNMTTAAEFAAFSREYIRLHPGSLAEFHSVQVFAYPTAANVPEAQRNNPRTIVQHNRNTLLRLLPGVDGLKTGFINQSGFNIALTAERDNTRFIAVLLGAPAGPGGALIREQDGNRLLSWAFDNFKTVRPNPNTLRIEPARLWKGRLNTAQLKIADSKTFTSPISRSQSLWYSVELNGPLVAPLSAGQKVGHLVILDEFGEVNRVPVLTAQAYEQGSIFRRIWHSIRLFFRR